MTRLAFLILVLVAAAAEGGENVYKWKDAGGVTHFSDSPPDNQSFEQVKVGMTPTPDTPAPVAGTDGAAAESPATAKSDYGTQPAGTPPPAPDHAANCKNARTNLETLVNARYVSLDRDGDGKPETLDNTARLEEMEKAKAQIDEFCK